MNTHPTNCWKYQTIFLWILPWSNLPVRSIKQTFSSELNDFIGNRQTALTYLHLKKCFFFVHSTRLRIQFDSILNCNSYHSYIITENTCIKMLANKRHSCFCRLSTSFLGTHNLLVLGLISSLMDWLNISFFFLFLPSNLVSHCKHLLNRWLVNHANHVSELESLKYFPNAQKNYGNKL